MGQANGEVRGTEEAGQGSAPMNESVSSRRLLTDHEIMACVKPEEIWKKVSKKAAEGI